MSKRIKKNEASEEQPNELSLRLPVGFPEDLSDMFLLRLPRACFLFRFRSVAKSWQTRFLKPDFIKKFIFQNTDLWNDPQLLIQRRQKGRSVYSLHSHRSLRLVSGPAQLEKLELGSGNFEVRCGCKGLFCLADGDGSGFSNIVLWNPATTQTKLLPVSNLDQALDGYARMSEVIGFGFDPEKNDYKVVRTVVRFTADEDIEESSEVYSLKIDSWRTIYIRPHDLPDTIHYSVPSESGDGRLFYWWGPLLDFISFDMRSEECEGMRLRYPDASMQRAFSVRSVSLVKGSTVVIFSDRSIDRHEPNELQTWVRLDFEDRMAGWIELSTIKSNKLNMCMHPVGIWKDKRCFLQRYEDGQLVVVDLEKGEVLPIELQIQGDWESFKIFPYTPCEVSLE
ncbi:unnamed protein product [Linum tenue]|uniref:F-box associated beta-propeller type 1 domain-containing protein n=1 Tax=Linum tenue TaxID=586396 RepID=A0AAV0I9Y3_9ROSI|nr:unnamed protein product [Linum tenue]